MITQILTHTPNWVFLLFALLLIFGFIQTRSRTVSRTPALLLPAGMIALSLSGIHSSFGFTPLPMMMWGLALLATASIGYFRFRDERISYDRQTLRFSMPGSWLPLAVMMAIFFTKYVFAVMKAFNASIISQPTFVATLCVTWGLLSGYFAARAINLIAHARNA